MCAVGSTSDANCGDMESCVRAAGESVSDCQSVCRDASLFCEDGSVTATMAADCEVCANADVSAAGFAEPMLSEAAFGGWLAGATALVCCNGC